MWPFGKKPSNSAPRATGSSRLDAWVRSIDSVGKAALARGGEYETIAIDPPLSERELVAIEADLGRPIPQSLRELARNYSAGFRVNWSIDSSERLPEFLSESASCLVEFSVADLPNLDERRKRWVESVFPDASDEHAAPWHHAMPFIHSPNGDLIAFDLRIGGNDPPVSYLNHEGHYPQSGHGRQLGTNFGDFMDRWSRLGCIGPESWTWIPFCTTPDGPLDPDSEAARTWRRAILGDA